MSLLLTDMKCRNVLDYVSNDSIEAAFDSLDGLPEFRLNDGCVIRPLTCGILLVKTGDTVEVFEWSEIVDWPEEEMIVDEILNVDDDILSMHED